MMKAHLEKKLARINKKVCRYYYSALQKLYEKVYGSRHKGGKVFLFHQVTDDKKRWVDADCAISKKGFEEFICALCDKGTAFGSIDALMKGGYEKKVFLTFDDIYADAVENAIPYLVEKRIPFCIFISDCYIGQKGYLSEEQLERLANEPFCTIGYHSKSHKIMRFMSEEEVLREMGADSLEGIVGRKLDYFAYPYGSFYAVSKKNREIAKSAGYRLIFSTVRMYIDEEIKCRYNVFLPRININENNFTKYMSDI